MNWPTFHFFSKWRIILCTNKDIFLQNINFYRKEKAQFEEKKIYTKIWIFCYDQKQITIIVFSRKPVTRIYLSHFLKKGEFSTFYVPYCHMLFRTWNRLKWAQKYWWFDRNFKMRFFQMVSYSVDHKSDFFVKIQFMLYN